jgi:hypothetical protein
MKLKFRGWSREVYPHSHDALPIKGGPGRRHPVGKAGEPLQWDNARTARARVNGLGLNGDFLVELEFEPEELKSWLSSYVKEHPEDAIRMLAPLQAEAVIALSSKKVGAAGDAA